MGIMNNIPKFVFIIDTEQYAGNFERKMTAYITGVVGDSDIGHKEAEEFKKEVSNISLFDEVLDFYSEPDSTFFHPCTILETPGWFNDGMGDHYPTGISKKYVLDRLNEKYNKAIESNKSSFWQDGKKKIAVKKYPAYLSVGIFFIQPPTKKQIEVMKERAKKFAQHKKIKITGFRLIEQQVKQINMKC